MFDGVQLKRKDPIVKIETNGRDVLIDVTASSEKELDNLMRPLRSRYNLNRGGQTFQEKREGPVDTTYSRVLDSIQIRRAVTKMAYSFLCDRVPMREVCSSAFDEVRAFIRGSQQEDMASGNYTLATDWTCDFVRPLHKIHISINRGNGLVVGFVTIFGMFRFTVLLSRYYNATLNWPALDYTYNPVSETVVEGNPIFSAPMMNESSILRPKQSIDLVRRELVKSNKMLEQYVKDYRFLDIEFLQPFQRKP